MMKKYILTILFLILSSPSWAALAVNSEEASNAGQRSTLSSTLSYSFTNTAGTVIFVAAAVTNSTLQTISTVTYGGDSLTEVPSSSIRSGISGGVKRNIVSWWYKLSPKTGSQTVLITASASSDAIMGGAISFTGNDTTTPYAVVNTAFDADVSSGTSATVTLAATTTGNLIIGACQTGSNVTAIGSGETLSFRTSTNNGLAGANLQATRKAAGGSVTLTETLSAGDWWGLSGVEVKAAASAGGLIVQGSIVTGGMIVKAN